MVVYKPSFFTPSFILTTTNTLSHYFINHPILITQTLLNSTFIHLTSNPTFFRKSSSSRTFFHISPAASFQLLYTQIHIFRTVLLFDFSKIHKMHFLISQYYAITDRSRVPRIWIEDYEPIYKDNNPWRYRVFMVS